MIAVGLLMTALLAGADLRDEEARLLDAIAATGAPDERTEALFRLGELERSRAVEADAAGDPASSRLHFERAERALSEGWRPESTCARPDLAYALGDLRRLRGDAKGARSAFEVLVRDCPIEPLSGDAALALGDDAFDAGDLVEAERRYTFARKSQHREMTRRYAAYKLAWCALNREAFDEARHHFDDVLSGAETMDGDVGTLRREARRDHVLACARDGSLGAKQAQALISVRHPEPDARHRALAEYAVLIASAGRDEEAATLLLGLVRPAPLARLPKVLAHQLELALRRRELETINAAALILGDVYEAFPSLEREALAEETLRAAAATMHGEGRAAGDPVRLDLAAILYAAYFRAFPAEPGGYELHHHAGELALLRGRSEDARQQFLAALSIDIGRMRSGASAGRWLDSSGHGLIEAAQALLPPIPDVSYGKKSNDRSVRVAPTALDDSEKLFVEACATYLEVLPDGQDAARAKFRRAVVWMQHHDDAAAAEAFADLATSGSELAAAAARLALECDARRGDFDALLTRLGQWRQSKTLTVLSADEWREWEETAQLASAQQRAERGDADEAIDRYIAFARVNAGPRGDLAAFNAAALLASQGRFVASIDARRPVLAGTGALAREAARIQVEALVEIGRFSEASHLLERLGEQDKAETERSFDQAVSLAIAAGEDQRAQQLRQRFVRRFPKSPRAFAHARHFAEASPGIEAWRRALSVARTRSERIIALTGLARSELKRGAEQASRAHANEVAGLARRGSDGLDDAARDAAAEALLLLVRPRLLAFERAPLAPPFERTVPKKLALLEQVDRQLATVIGQGRAAPTICALIASGGAYLGLGNRLQAVRAPRHYDAQARALFEQILAERAQPLVERGTESLERALHEARRAGIEPACLGEALALLAKALPDRFGPRTARLMRLAAEPDCEAGQDLIERLPDAPSAWLVAARCALAMGASGRALGFISRGDPSDPLSQELRAEALSRLGRHDEARRLWTHLGALHPDRTAAWRGLAARALVLGDDASAVAPLERLFENDPHDVAVAVDLALVRRRMGAPEAAAAILESVLRRPRPPPEASLALGLLWCDEGERPAEGLRLIDAVSGEWPGDASIARAREACAALAASESR